MSSSWPLISYLIDDDVYLQKNKRYLSSVVETAFKPSKINSKYSYYSTLIREYTIGTNGEQSGYTFLESEGDFDSAISYLKFHVSSRNSVVKNYVD